MNVTQLEDPGTGVAVRISFGQLNQDCKVCGKNLRGGYIVSVGEGSSWVCLAHLETALAAVSPRPGVEVPCTLETRTPRVKHVVLYDGGNFYKTALEGACDRAEADGMELSHVAHGGDSYVVAIFREAT